MSKLFNMDVDDESFDDDESPEVKDLKDKITLALVSITRSTKEAQANLDSGLYTKFLKNLSYIHAMVMGLSDLAQVLDLILNVRVEDLSACGVDIEEVKQQIQKIMNLITPTEVSQVEEFLGSKEKHNPKNKNPNGDNKPEDDCLW